MLVQYRIGELPLNWRIGTFASEKKIDSVVSMYLC